MQRYLNWRWRIRWKLQIQVKVKVPRNRPKGPEGGRGVALLFPDLGARREWVFSTTPPPLYPRERPSTRVQEAGWAPGPVWTCAKNLAPTDPLTVQLVASRHTNWATPAPTNSGLGIISYFCFYSKITTTTWNKENQQLFYYLIHIQGALPTSLANRQQVLALLIFGWAHYSCNKPRSREYEIIYQFNSTHIHTSLCKLKHMCITIYATCTWWLYLWLNQRQGPLSLSRLGMLLETETARQRKLHGALLWKAVW
jgi:hypothetical protein